MRYITLDQASTAGRIFLLIGVALGGVLGALIHSMIVTVRTPDSPSEPSEPKHQCPFCGRILRAITVQCLDDVCDPPIPPNAEWICPNGECEVYYFADRPAGKPAPIEEV